MGCYNERELQRLRAYRTRRRVNAARLANYKTLYLAARTARDYLKDVPLAESKTFVAQLDAALIDPHVKVRSETQEGEGV